MAGIAIYVIKKRREDLIKKEKEERRNSRLRRTAGTRTAASRNGGTEDTTPLLNKNQDPEKSIGKADIKDGTIGSGANKVKTRYKERYFILKEVR